VKRGKDVRIIAVAGPSSSGKTTFIKRLKIQLEVNGIHPVELSLDDYYKDRDQVARDPHGEQDFEALEALDLELLDHHIRRLLSGERVATARFDFVSGRSFPVGGPAMVLAPGDVLLVEGIHGLNPSLFGANEVGVFRVFVHVATSLPFDRLSWLEPADLRLVRRIVRDRHSRGTSTAESLARWTSVRRGERLHIHPFQGNADRIFDSALVYEPAVLKVFAERYLLEVPRNHPEFGAAERLRRLLDPIVPIHPDHVPPTSILREFIGSSGFSY
jgi:uridine kinase